MATRSGISKARLVGLLEAYRRPGTPVFAYHFRGLPASVLKPENCGQLVAILGDQELPGRVRDHAAGALGQIGCREAIPSLIAALGSTATRRGAATALGLMKAEKAREALAELAPKLNVARWAYGEVSAPRSVDEALARLRDGHLHRIRPQIAALDAESRAQVSAALGRLLQAQLDEGYLDHSHRWMVTALQWLAPPEAAGVVAEAVRLSIETTNCCGCLRKRVTWAAAAVGSPEAIPALVEMIVRLRRPQNVQQAAVCIEKLAKARPEEALPMLGEHVGSLRSTLAELEIEVAGTRRKTPTTSWDGSKGTPRWEAAMQKAVRALARVVALAAPADHHPRGPFSPNRVPPPPVSATRTAKPTLRPRMM